MKGVVGLIAILALGYALRGLLRYELGSVTSDRTACLEMQGSTTTEEDGVTFIVGNIKNNCSTRFGQVTVAFRLAPTPGVTENLATASAYAYCRDVEPGDVRQCKTALPVSKDASYRFEGINAF